MAGWLFSAILLESLLRISGISTPAFPLMGLAVLAFGLGLLDDHVTLPALTKLGGQMFIAFLFTLIYGSIDAIPLPGFGVIDLGFMGPLLTIFWIVAFMNAFNFMDGINGIAALAGTITAATLALVAASVGETAWAAVSLLLALALFGFLPLNFRAGRLFMGDSGSQLVSFLLATLGLLAARSSNGAVSHILIPIVMTPFLFDVAFTLAHRHLRKRNLFSPHCEHIYQLLVRLGWSHNMVATTYFTLTVICAGLAVITMSLGATAQWGAVVAIAGTAFVPAMRVFRMSFSQGLLEDAEPDDETLSPNMSAADSGGLLKQAAE